MPKLSTTTYKTERVNSYEVEFHFVDDKTRAKQTAIVKATDINEAARKVSNARREDKRAVSVDDVSEKSALVAFPRSTFLALAVEVGDDYVAGDAQKALLDAYASPEFVAYAKDLARRIATAEEMPTDEELTTALEG